MPKRIVLKIWKNVQEPKVITLLQTVLYALFALAGVGIIALPPSSLENVTGSVLSVVWGSFALLGGLLGMFATPTGKWFLERPGIYLCGTAVVFYLGTLGYLQVVSSGNPLVQMPFVAIAGIALAIRFERIRAFDYEPGK